MGPIYGVNLDTVASTNPQALEMVALVQQGLSAGNVTGVNAAEEAIVNSSHLSCPSPAALKAAMGNSASSALQMTKVGKHLLTRGERTRVSNEVKGRAKQVNRMPGFKL